MFKINLDWEKLRNNLHSFNKIGFVNSSIIGNQLYRKLNNKNSTLIIDEIKINPDDSISSIKKSLENFGLLVCFAESFSVSHHVLVNQIAVEKNIKVIFITIEEKNIIIGPVYKSLHSPCFECSRFRLIACKNDVKKAILKEIQLRKPFKKVSLKLDQRVQYIALKLIFKSLINFNIKDNIKNYFSKITVINIDNQHIENHYLLKREDCPICKKKRSLPDQLKNQSVEIYRSDSKLINPICGLIRKLEKIEYPLSKISSCSRPKLTRAYLSNYRLLSENTGELITYGKGWSEEKAKNSALGEAIERYSNNCWDESQVINNIFKDSKVKQFNKSNESSKKNTDFNITRTQFDYVIGFEKTTNKKVLVPANIVFSSYQSSQDKSHLIGNGVASGKSSCFAFKNALLEALERDSFMINWFNKYSICRLNPNTHPDSNIRCYAKAQEKLGNQIFLNLLYSEHPIKVVSAILLTGRKSRTRPAVSLGLGTGFTCNKAASNSILEMDLVFAELSNRLKSKKVRAIVQRLYDQPELINSSIHHGLFYAHQGSTKNIEFLMNSNVDNTRWENEQQLKPKTIEHLINSFAEKKQKLIEVDITPPILAELGWHTKKVLLPQLLPTIFGINRYNSKYDRLINFRRKVGLEVDQSLSKLNEDPHPLC